MNVFLSRARCCASVCDILCNVSACALLCLFLIREIEEDKD